MFQSFRLSIYTNNCHSALKSIIGDKKVKYQWVDNKPQIIQRMHQPMEQKIKPISNYYSKLKPNQ